MMGRITAGIIVAFWAGMMVALVRTEFFPQTSGAGDVPADVVLRKIFTHDEDTRLNVSYQGRDIGFCKVEIEPLTNRFVVVDGATVAAPLAYQVRSELTLALTVMGAPSHLRLEGKSRFNERFELDEFQLDTRIGEGQVHVRGDAVSNKVQVDFAFGEIRDHRVFDFTQLRGAGLASAMGLPGLANFSFLGGGGMPTAFGGADKEGLATKTKIYFDNLAVGKVSLRTYLIESRLDQNMWARMWVSQRGEVLKVETSFGLTMLADVLADSSVRVRDGRAAEDHDPH